MSYLIFNNISSEDYFIVETLPPIIKAKKDIEMLEVPGRDGFLTHDLGSYRSIIKSVECGIESSDNIDFISSWLTGSGEVIFSNEPDKKYYATIINQIDYSKFLWEFKKFIIQFECQPHKYSIEPTVLTLSSPGTIFNPGTVNSSSIFKVYGTGNISLTINNSTIQLVAIDGYVTLDSYLQDAYKDTHLMNNNMSGELPILIPGDNAISWIGTVSKIEVQTNWRWI